MHSSENKGRVRHLTLASSQTAAPREPANAPALQDRFSHLQIWRQTLAANTEQGFTNDAVQVICEAVDKQVASGAIHPEVAAAAAIALHEVSMVKANVFGCRMALGLLDVTQGRIATVNLKLLFAHYVLAQSPEKVTREQVVTARRLLEQVSWSAVDAEEGATADAIWGDIWRLGHQGRVDNSVAFVYYTAASHQNIPIAHYHLGRWYHGIDATWCCATPDLDRAASHYREGAQRGHSGCMTQLACLHLEGRMLGADPEAGLDLLGEAVRMREPAALSAAERMAQPVMGAELSPRAAQLGKLAHRLHATQVRH